MLSNAYGHRRSPSLRTGPIHPPPGPPQLALHHPPSYSQIYGTLGNAPIIVPSETTAVRSLSCKLFSVESHSPEFKPKSSTVTNTTVPTLKRRGARTRSSSSEFGTFQNSKFFFTPASAPSYAAPSSPPPAPKLPSKKPAPPPLFRSRTPPYNSKLSYPYSRSYRPPRMQADSEDERDDDSAIYTSWREPIRHTKSSTHLRTRVSSVTALSRGRDKPAKCISTTPGHYGAGETETEIDEPVSAPVRCPCFLPYHAQRRGQGLWRCTPPQGHC
jgi:hypothetical protein